MAATMLRTLSRTLVCCLVLLSGCGDDDDAGAPDRTEPFEQTPLRQPGESGTLKQTVCERLRPREVAGAVRRPGTRLEATPNDSLDLSVCQWHAPGVRVQMIADSAPRAQLRYYNQLAEQVQFFNADPSRRPYQIKGVGEDSAYGGAGAWWTRTKGQLVAYSKNRILRIRVVGRGFDDADKRRAAARLGRLGFRRLSEPAS
ncbi:MAG TPA: hypothetical protein VGW14_05805 [Thermoleophilaceae bacterium]|nr:hypothetical protein [Thermoleophilaceae bacterium]